MKFGEFIKRKREEKGLNFTEFANKIGVSRAHMNRIEEFNVIPSKSVSEKIAKGLNMSISDFEATAKEYGITIPEKRLPLKEISLFKMKRVKEINIVIVNKDILDAPEKNNIYQKIRDEQGIIIQLIKENGYVKETDSIKIDNNLVCFKLEDELCIEDCLEFIHILEKKYEVIRFNYETEYNQFYNKNPNALIWINI